MALPKAPAAAVEKKNGKICGSVKGVQVGSGDAIECSPLAPDSTRRPPTTPKPSR